MVERLQLSFSEGTKKLVSESIQINPIVPETPNLHRDTNQETRQATVQLNIVEDDENVMSEPCCTDCLNLLIGIIFCTGCSNSSFYVLNSSSDLDFELWVWPE